MTYGHEKFNGGWKFGVYKIYFERKKKWNEVNNLALAFGPHHWWIEWS
jgi:hypothetical protein